MQKIKIYLEYRCFPIWIYDDDHDELKNNDLPMELLGDKEVDDAFVNIQNIYDSLFLDSLTEFKYIGFKSESDRREFLKLLEQAINLIKAKLGDTYIIEKEIDI